MIDVLVTIEPQQARFDEFVQRLGDLLARVREEPGCHGVHWGIVAGEPRKVAIVERYAGQDALAAHHASAHMAEFGPGVMSLCAAPPIATTFEER